MPCQYYGPGEQQEINNRFLRKEMDRLSALLCSACKGVDVTLLPDDVQAWWAKHQEDDRKASEDAEVMLKLAEATKRKARERAIDSLGAKLESLKKVK